MHQLPIQYRWLKAHHFKLLTPWYFVDPDKSTNLRTEYQKESGQDILPFARRQDCDDLAGFKIINGEIQNQVLTVHLTWSSRLESPGYPTIAESADLLEWLKNIMLPDSKDWITEEDLEYYKENNP